MGKLPERQAPGQYGEKPRAHFPPPLGVFPPPHACSVISISNPGVTSLANMYSPPVLFCTTNVPLYIRVSHADIKALPAALSCVFFCKPLRISYYRDNYRCIVVR